MNSLYIETIEQRIEKNRKGRKGRKMLDRR